METNDIDMLLSRAEILSQQDVKQLSLTVKQQTVSTAFEPFLHDLFKTIRETGSSGSTENESVTNT